MSHSAWIHSRHLKTYVLGLLGSWTEPNESNDQDRSNLQHMSSNELHGTSMNFSCLDVGGRTGHKCQPRHIEGWWPHRWHISNINLRGVLTLCDYLNLDHPALTIRVETFCTLIYIQWWKIRLQWTWWKTKEKMNTPDTDDLTKMICRLAMQRMLQWT